MAASSSYPSPDWPRGIDPKTVPEIYSLDCMPDGSWVAEVRFDNLLHEGIGATQAEAIAAAMLEISNCLAESVTKSQSFENRTTPAQESTSIGHHRPHGAGPSDGHGNQQAAGEHKW